MVASFLVTLTLLSGAAPGASAPMAFGVATTAPDAVSDDDESTGVDDLHAAQYLPAPDPIGMGHDAYAAQPTGCAGLMLGFDQFCLGGLVSRAYSRSISYGLCGAIVGAIGGCFCGVLPLFIIQDGVDGINASLTACGSPVLLAIGSSAWIIMGLLGAVPGCISGGGCGAGLGLASAFLFPFDEQGRGSPPPAGQQPYPVDGRTPRDGGYDDDDDRDEPNVRRRPSRNDRTSPPQKPGSGRNGREDSTSSRNGRDDDTSGRSGREDNTTGRSGREDSTSGRSGRNSSGRSGQVSDPDRTDRPTAPSKRGSRGSRGRRVTDPDRDERAKENDDDSALGRERGSRRPRSEDDERDRTDHDGNDRD